MNYRKEIDGLRGLSVISVILFHAGCKIFSGGFVGVDIFFVISGYLITTLIIEEIEKGSFSLINFYERRALRILPPLFFVVLCTLPFAYLWMLPKDLKSFSQSLVAVPLFISNIHFYFTNGYFDTASEFKPLLHTWSIAVEEQYYTLFPIFLLLSLRLGRKWVVWLMIFIATVSLITAQIVSKNNPSFTYYFLPTRGFEILIGALTSLYLNHKKRIDSVNQSLSLAGLLLITYAIFTFDNKTPNPSVYTLIPTFGTSLIIIFANSKNLVGRILSNKILAGIGIISYGSYLWHQPLFVFARLSRIEEPSFLLLIILTISSILLGFLSWKYIETPFRSRKLISRNNIFPLSAIVSALLISVGLIGYTKDGFDKRFKEKYKTILEWEKYDYKYSLRSHLCFLEIEDNDIEFKDECFGKHTSESYLIWGDSYAAASYKGLIEFYKDVIQLTASSCPPLIDTNFARRSNCLKINEFIKEKVKQLKPKYIFLQSNWDNYTEENVLGNLYKTIDFIKSVSPSTKIVILGSAPRWYPSLTTAIIISKHKVNKASYVHMPYYEELVKVDAELIKLSNKEKVTFISLLDNLCIKNKCLAITQYNSDFWLTSWDNGHLTEAGSIYLFAKIKNLIQ